MGVIGALIGLFAASIGIIVAGVAAGGATILEPLFPAFINIQGTNPVLVFVVSIALTSLGVVFTLANVWLSRWFYRVTLKYLQWNIDVVKK